MQEASKTRQYFGVLEKKVFQGKGIDIGCGNDPILQDVHCFDVKDGDANYICRYVKKQYDRDSETAGERQRPLYGAEKAGGGPVGGDHDLVKLPGGESSFNGIGEQRLPGQREDVFVLQAL